MFNIFLNDFPTQQLNVAMLVGALSSGVGIDDAAGALNASIIDEFAKFGDTKKEKNFLSVYSAVRNGLEVSESDTVSVVEKVYDGYNFNDVLAVSEEFVRVLHESFRDDDDDIVGFIQSKIESFRSSENEIVKYIIGRRFLNLLLRLGNSRVIGSYIEYITEISSFIKGLGSDIKDAGDELIKWC